MATVVRIDRNGTKYWHEVKCPRCGGSGVIDWSRIYDGVCFKCGGSGIFEHDWKEYTPEYLEKRNAKMMAKRRAKASETNGKLFSLYGMSEDGKTWVVIGDTFSIKDQLKEAGAKFNPLFGWHFDHPAENTFEVSIDQIALQNDLGEWQLDNAVEVIEKLRDQYAPKSGSEYVGQIGDKLEARVRFVTSYSYETHITYRGETHYIYKFDLDGNTIIWNTTAWQDVDEGSEYLIKGTIKDHSEYKGDKQTVLTRCRISNIV